MLCKGKNDMVAERALRGYKSPIGDWTTAITTDLPDELVSSLPSIDEFEAELCRPTSGDNPRRPHRNLTGQPWGTASMHGA